MTELAAVPVADPAWSAGTAFIDGDFCPIGEAKISILDWGFLRSDATYDVVHVWKGRFFRLETHLDRFQSSMQTIRLAPKESRAEIAAILHQCVARAGLEDAYVEMICTRGLPQTGVRDPRRAENRFLAFAIPFGWILPPEEHARGMHIVISDIERIAPESVDPTVKNYHWLDLVKGLFEAYDRGGENVVLRDRHGNLAEGPGFNIFVVKDGAAATPDRGVLEGITRRTALELCTELGVAATARPVAIDELGAADEIFVTSTAGGIIPVTRIDGGVVANGTPGPVTEKLAALYWDKHADPAWTTPVAYS